MTINLFLLSPESDEDESLRSRFFFFSFFFFFFSFLLFFSFFFLLTCLAFGKIIYLHYITRSTLSRQVFFFLCILTTGQFLLFLHSAMAHSLALLSAPLFCDAVEKVFSKLLSCAVNSTNRLHSSELSIPMLLTVITPV